MTSTTPYLTHSFSLFKCVFGLCYSSTHLSASNESLNEQATINEFKPVLEIIEINQTHSDESVVLNNCLDDDNNDLVSTDDIEITRNEEKWNDNYKKLKLSNFFG